MPSKLVVASSPHIRGKFTTQAIMRDVVIALLPAAAYGVYLFGIRAAIILILSVASAVLTEWACQKVRKQKITINDYSAVVTGLLLGMNVSSAVPYWMPVIGSIFAIGIVKQAFGGLGHNFMNPALGARVFLVASWPVAMTTWPAPFEKYVPDMITGATPLAAMKVGDPVPGMTDIILGNVGGCIGETSAILLLIGGLYLLYRQVISFKMPAIIIGTTAVLSFLFSGFDVTATIYHVFSGGLFLGAIFMATDYASSPMNPKAQTVYAISIGLLIAIIRFFGGYPEGVSFAIIIMNVVSPLADKYMRPRVFGTFKKKAQAGGKK